LPPQQKATLTLRVHQGLNHKEIAEVLDCSEGTAKANYFHAVRALQRKLQAIFEGSDDKEVYLRADKEAPYGAVVKAMAAAVG